MKKSVKGLSQDRAWELCLKQWKYVVKKLKTEPFDKCFDSYYYKESWLRNNGFKEVVVSSCFFCHYNHQKNAYFETCDKCPMKKYVEDFEPYYCERVKNWIHKPIEFYEFLKELNNKRLKNKKKVSK